MVLSHLGRGLGAASAIAALLAASPGARAQGAAVAKTSRPEATPQLDWVITRMDYPPKVLAHVNALKSDAAATSPKLDVSTAPPVRKYREFLDHLATRRMSQLEQVKAVNRYVFTHVERKPDVGLDTWAAPLQTLLTGGDCEDVALVKYWGLKRLGFARQDMFMIMGVTLLTRPPQGHALLAVRLSDGSFQVMYSLLPKVENARSLTYFEPAYALNEYGIWRIDEPGVKRDYWQAAFVRAVQRQER